MKSSGRTHWHSMYAIALRVVASSLPAKSGRTPKETLQPTASDRACPRGGYSFVAMAGGDAEREVAAASVEERHDQSNCAAAQNGVAVRIAGEHRAHARQGESLALNEKGQVSIADSDQSRQGRVGGTGRVTWRPRLWTRDHGAAGG